jgi:hypothetical protein
VINLTDGHLADILAIKLKANQQEIAILDEEGVYSIICNLYLNIKMAQNSM